MRKNLTRRERLRGRRALTRAFSSSQQASCPGAKLKYVANDLEWNRIVISLSRKFGTAVKRNRAKRTVREIYRILKYELLRGYDIAVILFPGEIDPQSRERQLRELFRRAGLLPAAPPQGHDQ